MLEWLLLVPLVGLLFVVAWDDIRDAVARWLRDRGLAKSALMDAWVQLDRRATRARARVFVRRVGGNVQEVRTEFLRIDEIPDAAVRRALRRGELKSINLMQEL